MKLLLLVLMWIASDCLAQDYPAKSVRLVAAAAPGGNPDVLGRMLAAKLSESPLEQLAVSPQCGFGSDVVGNLVSEDDQKRKLERVVELARKVWA